MSNTLKKLGFSGTVLNGKGLLSLLFPNDLYINEEDLKINRGVIYDGCLQKNIYLQLNLLLLKYCIKNMVWKHVPLFE